CSSRQRLLVVSEELDEAELAALKFLSLEHVPMRRLEAIQKAQDFFEALQEKGMIEAGSLAFLKELLYRLGRIDLLEAQLGSSREEMERELQIPGRAKVSAYRYLLFQLSEDITEDELKSFKFLLGRELPKCRLNPKTTMLDVFIEMEKKGILGEDNLSMLKSLCAEINIILLKRIEDTLCGFTPCGLSVMVWVSGRGLLSCGAQTPRGGGAAHCQALGAKLYRESCLERKPAGSLPCCATSEG
uniref:Caspase 8 n=1 Tax=Strix occidentalis caurina TaxID=311401 RepID=A0A8D0FVM2_STROC